MSGDATIYSLDNTAAYDGYCMEQLPQTTHEYGPQKLQAKP